MKQYICIHAHCYQPPRENPWLEAVEHQDSAYPYHDWNERVNAECYAQNAAARILDAQEYIARIVNNFSAISFNIGPTLLSWMEERDPDTYQAILDADRDSQLRFSGHGAAIAQVYNHIIMPLASPRDKQTQVIWGIRDFEHRFGRRPEGMWLAETAVDIATLEVLADHGIRFTILSPYQARRIRPLGAVENNNAASGERGTPDAGSGNATNAEARESSWIDVQGGKIDPSRAYVQPLPSGRSIALFFYDGPVAQAVAFERLLDSGDRFFQRLMQGFSDKRAWPQLMHIATDGESYGHHHRHGEMALAYALNLAQRSPDVELTVYGEYLERHPPDHEVEIFENTAWSCYHGIDRWQDNCGCNTGRPGWQQTWRRPLRDALDWLRDELSSRYQAGAGELFLDPWAARDDYVDVLLNRDRDNVEAFLQRHQRRDLTPDEQRTALMFLELGRQAMLMYTSCGWFFDDLSGIETVQVMRYAGRAVQLAHLLFGDTLEEEFVGRLEEARSNLPRWRDGRTIYDRAVRPAVVSLAKVGAHYAVSSLFTAYPDTSRVYCYDVERHAEDVYTAGRMKLLIGRAQVTSTITWNTSSMSYAVVHFGDTHVLGGVREHPGDDEWQPIAANLRDVFSRADLVQVVRVFDDNFPEHFALPTLFRDEQQKVLDQLLTATLQRADNAYLAIYRENATLMRFLADCNMPVPRPLDTAASHALTYLLQQAFAEKQDLNRAQIAGLLAEVKERNVALDEATLGYKLEHRLEAIARDLDKDPLDHARLRALTSWVDTLALLPFEVDLWQVQNIYYKLIADVFVQQRIKVMAGDEDASAWCSLFVALGKSLRVRVEGSGADGA